MAQSLQGVLAPCPLLPGCRERGRDSRSCPRATHCPSPPCLPSGSPRRVPPAPTKEVDGDGELWTQLQGLNCTWLWGHEASHPQHPSTISPCTDPATWAWQSSGCKMGKGQGSKQDSPHPPALHPRTRGCPPPPQRPSLQCQAAAARGQRGFTPPHPRQPRFGALAATLDHPLPHPMAYPAGKGPPGCAPCSYRGWWWGPRHQATAWAGGQRSVSCERCTPRCPPLTPVSPIDPGGSALPALQPLWALIPEGTSPFPHRDTRTLSPAPVALLLTLVSSGRLSPAWGQCSSSTSSSCWGGTARVSVSVLMSLWVGGEPTSVPGARAAGTRSLQHGASAALGQVGREGAGDGEGKGRASQELLTRRRASRRLSFSRVTTVK